MQKGIWEFEHYIKPISQEFHLNLNEGNTALEGLTINSQKIWFKREDQNPQKSFKDRSMAYWLSFYNAQGKKDFVISSSGNAAASAIAYCKLFGANLKVFVSENIPDYKFDNLINLKADSGNIEIVKSRKPKSDAFKFAQSNNFINLRGSTDNNAIEGFKTIAFELNEKNPDAVFVCCSSGTSLIGIYEGFKQLNKLPQLHIVQTTRIHSIASHFDNNFSKSPSSIANAVSDKVANRKKQVISVIEESNGSGWVVSDNDLVEAKAELVENGIEIEGYNAYVGYAGLKKALNHGRHFENPVCIISGI